MDTGLRGNTYTLCLRPNVCDGAYCHRDPCVRRARRNTIQNVSYCYYKRATRFQRVWAVGRERSERSIFHVKKQRARTRSDCVRTAVSNKAVRR